jgi:carboxymethylenebutenolidase
VLLLPDIFGFSDYIRWVAEGLSTEGYLVGVPDLFWRQTPTWSASRSALDTALELESRFDYSLGTQDLLVALDELSRLPQADGRTSMIGFCLGGSLAYSLAALGSPTAAVSFYGSVIPAERGLLGRIQCPLQLHFGGRDPYIPLHDVRQLEAVAVGYDNVEVHIEERAGHAFHNPLATGAGGKYSPAAARRAWRKTTRFLDQHVLRAYDRRLSEDPLHPALPK